MFFFIDGNKNDISTQKRERRQMRIPWRDNEECVLRQLIPHVAYWDICIEWTRSVIARWKTVKSHNRMEIMYNHGRLCPEGTRYT